ncbi:hypothetical protein DVH24_037521 [Malus domestica]|uniref:Uncharacterized protein n=1 Tax=Malus domestica TaxID=3750 RepID=A0A498I9X5_MALDO|nr:hypothetical protein DVH24_037521 [Malus domestica]
MGRGRPCYITMMTCFNLRSLLPPHRDINHRIPFLPGTGPVNVRPYHYGHAQKAELKWEVDMMLATGIIRPALALSRRPLC